MQQIDWKNPDYPSMFQERADRLLWIRSNPSEVHNLKHYYKENIPKFINDWGMTFDPRNAEIGLPSVIPFILFPRQVEWIEWIIDHWRNQRPGLTEKSRDMGMSWVSVALAASLCLLKDGLVIGFGSRKEEYVDKAGSPKSLFWKAKFFIENLPPEFRDGWETKKHSSHMKISFPKTGSTMTGEAGDGIGRGDRASIYFVDESAHLERPQLTEASLSQTTNCRIDLSSVNGMNNVFAEKRHSGKVDVFEFDWREDPRKDKAWYEKQKEELDKTTLAQEVDRDYNASSDDVLIQIAWFNSCIDAHKELGFEPLGAKMAAHDPSDEGSDSKTYGMRHGSVLLKLEEKTTGNVNEGGHWATGHAINDQVDHYTWDCDGMGLALREQTSKAFNGKHTVVTTFKGSEGVDFPDSIYEPVEGKQLSGKPITNKDAIRNKRAQYYLELRKRIYNTHLAVTKRQYFDPEKLISIDSSVKMLSKLRAELCRMPIKPNGNGLFELYTKEVMKIKFKFASPNLADNLMMLMRQPFNLRQNIGVMPQPIKPMGRR